MLLERLSPTNPRPIVYLEEVLSRVRSDPETTKRKLKFLRSRPERGEFRAAARRMVYFAHKTPDGLIVQLVDQEGNRIERSDQPGTDWEIGMQYLRRQTGLQNVDLSEKNLKSPS